MFLELLFIGAMSMAQTANIKDIPTDVEGETTISISKGKKAGAVFEITEGNAEIAGDPDLMVKGARTSWKKTCDDWRKEIKDLNKDNQVLVVNCNSPKCSKNETSETVCVSTGTYRLKVKMN